METIKALTNLSERLDQSGLDSYADQIDKTAESITKIVKAQFEGGLGYAIRNSRCWERCYRVNRVKNPKKSAQEVVFSCWEEYNKSIGDNNSGWEKYADEDAPIIKTASKELSDKVVGLVKAGSTVTEAFAAVDADERHKLTVALIEKADDLVKMSSKLKKMDKKASAELLVISHNLIKEAGFWGGLMGKGEVYKQGLDHFKQDAATLKQLLQGIVSQPDNALNYTKKVSGFITKILQNLRYFQEQGGLTGRAIRPIATQAQQLLLPFNNVFLSAKDADQAVQAAQSLTTVVDQLLQQAGLVEQQAAQAEQQEGSQQEQQGQPDILQQIATAEPAKLTEIVNNLLNDQTTAAAVKAWFASLTKAASFNFKKYKHAQYGVAPAAGASADGAENVPQIMNAISAKIGPSFNEWFKTNFGAKMGLAATEVQQPAEAPTIEAAQAIQALKAISDKAQTVFPQIPKAEQKRFRARISQIATLDVAVKYLEAMMTQVSQQGQMMGYNTPEAGVSEVAPSSGVIGPTQ